MVTCEPVRLVLLHHAGGSRLLYRGWASHLPKAWDIIVPDAPGRGFAHNSPLPDSIDDIAAPIAEQIAVAEPMPLGIFGHSMGAAVAVRVTTLLAEQGAPAPFWLGLSAWSGEPRHSTNTMVGTSEDQLTDLLLQIGGTPTRMLTEPTLRRLILPILRADLTALSKFDPRSDLDWLEVPISLFAGRDDAANDLDWQVQMKTAARMLIGTHVHPGDHFYLTDRAAKVAAQIVDDMRIALGLTPAPHLTTRRV